ncbi:uncharacterized protein CIMG_13474 [Coccidioides immitis RS]|uniref:Uncharacterized protein n=1 Tax=Coccidioides immitis (strain RS) TaxID=246410 RepID=A0A0E1S3Y8_COCIM|nr:uncharacterized protein CIMG_13474 [Coccidioides immitis RS]EAS34530.2 hypothetical protein CIMG_13474 [Coccidioides immitis RS]
MAAPNKVWGNFPGKSMDGLLATNLGDACMINPYADMCSPPTGNELVILIRL